MKIEVWKSYKSLFSSLDEQPIRSRLCSPIIFRLESFTSTAGNKDITWLSLSAALRILKVWQILYFFFILFILLGQNEDNSKWEEGRVRYKDQNIFVSLTWIWASKRLTQNVSKFSHVKNLSFWSLDNLLSRKRRSIYSTMRIL